jgi:hypothetical protein
MELNSMQIRMPKRVCPTAAGVLAVAAARRVGRSKAESKGDGTMQREIRSLRIAAVRAHPAADLLQCPPAIGTLLSDAAQSISFGAGELVFAQSALCRGLYLVIAGQFLRRAERLQTRLTLGPTCAGDLVELAAALGDGHHTYTLAAQSAGSVLMLPMEALSQAFQSYPPLRMHLLEELAREVSRAYLTCCLSRAVKPRQRNSAT